MSLNIQYSTADLEWAAEVAKPKFRLEPPKDVEEFRKLIDETLIAENKRHFEPRLPHASTYRVVDYAAPLSGGGDTRVRVITPISLDGSQNDKTFPCIVWYHGGGFRGGSVEFDDYRMRIIAVRCSIVAAVLEYRLAPQHVFPTAHRDSYDGIKWVAENAHTLGADLQKGFIIGGVSAGGNIAASLAYRVQQDPFFEGRRLTGQILQSPNLIHPRGYPEEYRDDLQSINMPEGQEWTQLTREYLFEQFDETIKAPPEDPEASPLLYTNRQILPPTYVQVAGLDPLRDENILYERLIRQAGVRTRISIYPGVPHGFNISCPWLTVSNKCEEDLREGVEWVLGLINIEKI